MAVRVSKLEFMAQRLAAEQARGLYGNKQFDWSTRQWVKPDGTPAKTPSPPNAFGKTGTLSKQIDKQLAGFEKDRQKAVNQAVANKAPKHARLVFNGDSTCLAELTWKDGVATATFFRGGAVVYDYPMSRDEFIEWVSSDDGIGRYGNDNVF
jgi:hypothetical protein